MAAELDIGVVEGTAEPVTRPIRYQEPEVLRQRLEDRGPSRRIASASVDDYDSGPTAELQEVSVDRGILQGDESRLCLYAETAEHLASLSLELFATGRDATPGTIDIEANCKGNKERHDDRNGASHDRS